MINFLAKNKFKNFEKLANIKNKSIYKIIEYIKLVIYSKL